MSESHKYSRAEIEALEVAPGAERRDLRGWVPELAGEEELRRALDAALDYRGDVTLTLKGGERVEAYIFDRRAGRGLEDSVVRYFAPDSPEKRVLRYADIARIEFTGRDCAAGKQWEDWVRKYNERKAAGEKNIALTPEALD